MRTIFLILALFATSCASEKPVVTVPAPKRVETPPNACDILVSAINRQDWEALKPWTKPGSSSNTTVQAWQNAAEKREPGEKNGRNSSTGKRWARPSKKPYQRLYSYSLENKDGTVNPHWLQIKVREDGGEAEVVDFWNFGW